MNKLIVRKIREEEVSTVADFHPDFDKEDEWSDIRQHYMNQENGIATLLVGELQGRIIGHIQITRSNYRGSAIDISDLFILDEFRLDRLNHYGSQLLAAAEEEAFNSVPKVYGN